MKVRKDLSADGLISVIQKGFDAIPEPEQRENHDISLSDALMSAFAMFSLKDPSLLAFDERRRDPNDSFRSIYGIQNVPCDTQMRTILDPVEPEALYPLFLARASPPCLVRADGAARLRRSAAPSADNCRCARIFSRKQYPKRLRNTDLQPSAAW